MINYLYLVLNNVNLKLCLFHMNMFSLFYSSLVTMLSGQDRVEVDLNLSPLKKKKNIDTPNTHICTLLYT